MNILLASDSFIPMINGVVTSTLTLYTELKKLGHDVKVLALSEDGKEKVVGDFYYLKSFKINVYPDARANFAIKNNILHQIYEWNPDIIHTQTEFTVQLIARRIKAKCNAASIHTYHTMYEDYTNFLIKNKRINKNVVGKISKHFLNSTDGVVAPTNKTYEVLERYGVNVPIKIVPTGIDLSKFNQTITNEEKDTFRKTYNIDKDKDIILYLGRISEEKNIEEILEYISQDKDFFKNKIFFIAGGGPYLDNLKQIAKDKNILDYVRFSGMINPKDTYMFYKMGDIFCTASTSETQGLTYIEALASGTPVVCRYDNCIKDVVINGKTGYSYTNYNEFKQSLDNILENPTFYTMLKKNALLISSNYSSQTFAREIEQFYLEAISKKESLLKKDENFYRQPSFPLENMLLKYIKKS